MIRKIITTEDNSKSIQLPEWNETYHSTHGALNESLHIYIRSGLIPAAEKNKTLKIFEMGFGTGLNALLTLDQSVKEKLTVEYHTLENYPVEYELVGQLHHTENEDMDHLKNSFDLMHLCDFSVLTPILDSFSFIKYKDDLLKFEIPANQFNVIYFDAFGPRIQPELWSAAMMQKMFNMLLPGGRLVTYCAQGQFRRNLREAGFTTHKLEGPKGKREMTLALKPE
ncbi:MAG: tRNA (5-methylaminomethyl-2-thiouridine)(34)-methyltransferase MnmD [Crocinitomicaceae bacterium]|nr:tRNA (5-methylaminomethyl-2-thiouridine)(34)-methyltransferase MnmD [Crocinitomicaceae bacterium]